MDYSGRLIPSDAVGYFCVASENVRHPIQVVTSGRFLVGSGSNCHLRLGERGIPDVLCVVTATERGAMLECSADEPAVLVNGMQAESAALCDGDLLEVGSYRLLFRLLSEETRITLDELHFAPASQTPSKSSEPTAAELVELLQQELQTIQEHDRTARDSVAELLAAASAATEEFESGHNLAATTAFRVTGEVSASDALQQVTDILHRQHEASRIRMESVTEVLNNVVRQQQAVADSLQLLSQRIVAMESSRDFVQRRASA